MTPGRPQDDPRWTLGRPENDPGWTPDGPRTDPGRAPDGPRTVSEPEEPEEPKTLRFPLYFRFSGRLKSRLGTCLYLVGTRLGHQGDPSDLTLSLFS